MPGFSFILRFLRVITNAYFVRAMRSSARNFSNSPKKPAHIGCCLTWHLCSLAAICPSIYVIGDIESVGLTACSGDSWRDTVENHPLIVCGHACGGPDGARH